MPIRITCTCGYAAEAPDWSSSGPGLCPGCGRTVRKTAVSNAEATNTPPVSPDPEPADGGIRATKPCPFCGEQILLTAVKCRYCGELFGTALSSSMDPEQVLAEYRELKADRRRCSLLSIGFGMSGIGLSISALLALNIVGSRPGDTLVALLLSCGGMFGYILLGIGFVFAAKYKGRNPTWAMVVLLHWVGILIMLFLKDYKAERLTHLKAMLTILGHKV